ncbi:MAG: 16S rRNA (cytosine(1402)-N(4))-methyltransferase RsmH [Oscillospiraceae bacterium]|jgi:16S rRNA (cytosine1402-N4)-methyltransferase|nr:16S rRNA (cytosine(1402)-N(4))-methyltransferase RsmH [Oscillospiraceae bacterium]
MKIIHEPVLLNEVVELLDIKKNGVYVDATAGFGGHSRAIFDRLKSGKLFMIDQDPDAISALKKDFKSKTVTIINDNFINIKNIIKSYNIDFVDGILLDVGVSSYQIDSSQRGFSYHDQSAPLDMRMSKKGKSAKDIINTYEEKELSKIIWDYSEEKFSRRIAEKIVARRKISPIETTDDLVQIIKSAIPFKFLRKSLIHPARRTFQAIRIEVNKELQMLEKGLTEAFSVLKAGGRLAVITFHSLEDRIVKKKMASWCIKCTCPPDFPICICRGSCDAKLITKKPVTPSAEEINRNNRSRSAKLRVVCRVK